MQCTLLNMVSDLSADNLVFIAGTAYNVWRKLECGKNWEGQRTISKAKYLAYACVCSDTGWPRHIMRGSVHILARIVGYQSGGREGYGCDFLLADMFRIVPPIPLPHGVGQNRRFPNASNGHLHSAFEALRSIRVMLH